MDKKIDTWTYTNDFFSKKLWECEISVFLKIQIASYLFFFYLRWFSRLR